MARPVVRAACRRASYDVRSLALDELDLVAVRILDEGDHRGVRPSPARLRASPLPPFARTASQAFTQLSTFDGEVAEAPPISYLARRSCR